MSNDAKKTQLVMELMDIAAELDWNVALISEDFSKPVKGLILGDEEYLMAFAGYLYDAEIFSMDKKDGIIREISHEFHKAKKKKTETNH